MRVPKAVISRSGRRSASRKSTNCEAARNHSHRFWRKNFLWSEYHVTSTIKLITGWSYVNHVSIGHNHLSTTPQSHPNHRRITNHLMIFVNHILRVNSKREFGDLNSVELVAQMTIKTRVNLRDSPRFLIILYL